MASSNFETEHSAEGQRFNYSIALSTKAGTGRSRVPLAMAGIRYKGSQKIDITRAMLAQVVANFRKDDRGRVPIDYEHGILDAPAGQPVPAAGWIVAIDDAPDSQGLLWGNVEWTDRAAGMIAAKEYQYISPVIEGKRDNKTGDPQGWTLTSAALTNTPVLQGMPALVLSESLWTDERREGVGSLDFSDGSNTWGALQLELGQRAKELMKNQPQMGLGEAQRQVMIDDSHFAQEYEAARRRWLGSGNGAYTAQSQDDAAKAGAELSGIVTQRIAASEGKLDYGAAQQLVLRERPDLRDRIIAGMRRG